MIHATYITYMSSENEVDLGLPSLGVRFLADSNSSNMNGTPNLRIVRQMLKRTEPASFWQCSCTA